MSPEDLGRLGGELDRLFGWPPQEPAYVKVVEVTAGEGLAAGRAEADALADSGVGLLAVSAPGVRPGPLVALAVLLELDPVAVVGTAPGPEWARTVVAVRSAIPAARELLPEPAELLAFLDDPVLGRVVGLLARSAERETPVLLGPDPTVAAAALLAARIVWGAPRRWLLASRPPGRAARQGAESMMLEPLLDLEVAAGGERLALALLRAGIELARG